MMIKRMQKRPVPDHLVSYEHQPHKPTRINMSKNYQFGVEIVFWDLKKTIVVIFTCRI